MTCVLVKLVGHDWGAIVVWQLALLAPELYADPDERFAWMRANAPVYWDDATGIWGLASHEAVRIVAKDWQTFCPGQGSRPDSSVPSMINMDAPQHSFRRGIIKDGFTVRRVDDNEPYLRAKVGQLLDAVAVVVAVVCGAPGAPGGVPKKRRGGREGAVGGGGGPPPGRTCTGPRRTRRATPMREATYE